MARIEHTYEQYRYHHPCPRVTLANLDRWVAGERRGAPEFHNARGDRVFRGSGGWHFVRADGGALNVSLRGALDRLLAAERNGSVRLHQPSPRHP